MIDALSEGIEKSLYVDDLAVYCQSSTMAITERRLQDFLDNLVTCADENGFKFSPTKTLRVHFGKKMAYNLSLVSNAMDNSFMLSIFIGVFFDRKLNLILECKIQRI